MDSGTWIKQLLEERFIKASDVERLSRSIAEGKGNSDYYVSHATLADIAAGSIPSIYKIFSSGGLSEVALRTAFARVWHRPERSRRYGVAGNLCEPNSRPSIRERPAFASSYSLIIRSTSTKLPCCIRTWCREDITRIFPSRVQSPAVFDTGSLVLRTKVGRRDSAGFSG